MSKREAFARYNLIIKMLRKYPSSFNSISNFLKRESEIQSYNFEISKRTFQRDLEDIRSLFNIDIQFNFTDKVYFIHNPSDSLANERLLEAFDTFNTLQLSSDLSKYIYFEKRKSKGTEHLFDILYSLKNKLQIKFNYYNFWTDEVTHRSVSPYILKEFKNRWYLMAKDDKDNQIKSFALDRLSELETTKKKIVGHIPIDWEERFQFSFGITDSKYKNPKDIILSFNINQGKYVKSVPIHSSQEIVIENDDELQVKLKLFITHELIMEILSYGESVRVIKPLELVNIMKRKYSKSLNLYESE